MSELKTRPGKSSVKKFIESVEHPTRQSDAFTLLEMMEKITGEKPVMWGSSIIGFGSYHYQYASGKEGDWLRIGFSPRKNSLSLYIMDGFTQYEMLLKKLGKHKTGKSCLYINKLADVDLNILEEMIRLSFHTAAMGEERKS